MLYKKKLGQHFLTDQNIVNKLVKYIDPRQDDCIVEIGPGDGAMTKTIINKIKKIILIEKDSDLIDVLNKVISESPNSELINIDILKYDLTSIQNSIRVIGNLPYNISTEIIFKMCHSYNISDIHFMLQKEVVDRIVARENSKIYGRLSVMSQAYFEVKKLFDISNNVFSPKPKVKSSFIKLLPRKNVFDNKDHEDAFYRIVKCSFEGRRKMIKKSLGLFLNNQDFDTLKIKPELRAENLTIDEYIMISKYVTKI